MSLSAQGKDIVGFWGSEAVFDAEQDVAFLNGIVKFGVACLLKWSRSPRAQVRRRLRTSWKTTRPLEHFRPDIIYKVVEEC